jgi:curved DNA-binding protein
MKFKDYYQIMGVERDATQDEIKRAYRQLARKYHPDVSQSPDAEMRFKELGEANAVLKDPEKRAAYDQLGSKWEAGQDFRPPPDWNSGFEFSGQGHGPSGAASDQFGSARDFSDFFESLYGQQFDLGRQTHRNDHGAGKDHHAKVMIELEDSYVGATRPFTLHTTEVDAQGHVGLRAHQLNVTIPRGIRSGQRIRLTGQGSPGNGQGQAGDLYLEIGFNDHALYRVEQGDVFLDLPLCPWEAALGAVLKIPTPSGIVDLKIPAGSMGGNKLRLKGRGIPSITKLAAGVGDFYVVLRIVLSPVVEELDRTFYSNMAEQFSAFTPRATLGV